MRGSSDVAPFRGGRGPSTVARPVAYVGDSPDGPLRALIIDDRMTLPWGGRVPLQSALHRQARPIRSRSRGVVREVLQTGGPQSAPHAQWRPIIGASRGGALVQHTGGAFNRSWSSNAPLRRRLLTIAEGCDIVARAWAQGSMQSLAAETLRGRGVASRHPDHSRSALTSGALQRGIATDPLGPSLRSGPDRGLLSPML